MNFPFFIAKRYFFSRNIANVIHVISLVSLIGVTVGSFALIVVLSVFNGFENVVLSLYNSFDSDLKVTPKKGKYFHPVADLPKGDTTKKTVHLLDEIKQWNQVANASYVIEENVLVKYDNRQTIATMKAVAPDYVSAMGVDTMIYGGQDYLKKGETPFAIVGAGIASKISLNIYDETGKMAIFTPDQSLSGFNLNPKKAFRKKRLKTSGIFSIQQDFDDKYFVAPLSFGRKLLNEQERVTGLEVSVKSDGMLEKVRARLKETLGTDFEVKDRYQQHAHLYQVMRFEKLAVYLILTFILIIAAFNLIGSLLMLAIEKKKDMAILKTMGAGSNAIQRIFFLEGLLLSMSGALVGLGLGSFVCWLQMKFQLITLAGNSTFVLDAYPVDFEWLDFIAVFLTVTILGIVASYYPARVAYRQLSVKDLQQ